MITTSNFKLRFITGTLGSILLILSILNPWTYCVMFLSILLSCLKEFYSILKENGYDPFTYLSLLIGSFFFILSFMISANIVPGLYYTSLLIIFPIICGVVLYQKNLSNALINLSLSFAGIIYIVIPFSILNLLTFQSGTYEYSCLLFILIYTWVTESGSYFGGKIFGKTKLSNISPNKTWEGVISGLTSNLCLSVILYHYFNYSFVFCLIFGSIVLIIGIFGDLFESLVKRSFSLKDSSNTLPGHGGYLDRFDSLLFIIPFIYFYLLFIKHLT